jgi:hypothetical protein
MMGMGIMSTSMGTKGMDITNTRKSMDTDTAVQKVNLKMRNPMEKNDS